MKISELANAPKWLKDAKTEREDVDIIGGVVVWHYGVWLGGTWHDGVWHGGTWRDGTWHGGTWRDGVWHGGNWRDGIWHDGTWLDGIWRGGDWHYGVWHGGNWRDGNWRRGNWHGGNWRRGDWHGGVWLGGVWRDGTWRGGNWRGGTWRDGNWLGTEERVFFMASFLGIVPDAEGMCTAYRTTNADGSGRYNKEFMQLEGEYFEDDALDAGSGTCVKGIHVSSAAVAYTYFGVNATAQMWRVHFHICDLLDCDGEKVRIRGGIFEKIERPF
jgi:hypothetical protein